MLGSDYMLTMPEDYEGGMKKCAARGDFEFTRWGNEGLGEMAPLWMLKYLPNMPASHIAIYNDLRGPNNSLTMREAAGNLAIGEAFRTIQRGHANLMVAGATGTRILPMQAIHALQTEQMAAENCDPTKASRPFDKNRTGMVAGEGAGMVVLEELSSARARGATIYAEVVGLGSANVADSELARQVRRRAGPRDEGRPPRCRPLARRRRPHQRPRPQHDRPRRRRSPRYPRSLRLACRQGARDRAEELLRQSRRGQRRWLNLIASVLALREGRLPRVLNYETPDPACPLDVAKSDGTPAGRSFLNLSVTPQGQAAVLFVAAVD